VILSLPHSRTPWLHPSVSPHLESVVPLPSRPCEYSRHGRSWFASSTLCLSGPFPAGSQSITASNITRPLSHGFMTTSSQKWRPPVAPKPSLAIPTTTSRNRDVSPALRGATLAFSPAAKPVTTQDESGSTRGALNAAATAERLGRNHEYRQSADLRNAASPVRGRSQLTLDLQKATEHAARLESRNPLQRTASEIAARAASASSSPARSYVGTSRAGSPQHRYQSHSRESSASAHGRKLSDDARDALKGATLSMAVAPPTSMTSTSSSPVGKFDFSKVPGLAQKVASKPLPVKPSRKRTGMNLAADTQTFGSQSVGKDVKTSDIKATSHDNTFEHPVRAAAIETPTSARTPTLTITRTPLEKDHVPEKSPSNLAKRAARPIPVPPPPRGRLSTHSGSGAAKAPSTWEHRAGLSANNLANAMVASSLASSRTGSRTGSPAKHNPPVSPRHRSRSLEMFHAQYTGEKHAPLKPPQKHQMRTTMRKHSPEDDEEDDPRRGRKHLIRKHPHMHQEGARKRWRDKINERERKRYEGVWAANRGLLHEFETASAFKRRPQDSSQEELVLNVVVKDIWSRSRLPHDVLEEVWDLVSPEEEYKALDRVRFVVGMWLIDQRLKGRKLPTKVSASVWQSARHVGIKISSKPF
jgi:hypothetical protein